MQVEIITIGDEILIGQTVNTNAAWIGEHLSIEGIPINKVTTIKDDKNEIIKALKNAEQDNTITLITGGLGPTKDDITKKTLCEYFNTELELNETVLKGITKAFEELNLELLQVNRDQALLPKECIIIKNELGTASGMWFERNGKVFISMPGVPYEMKNMMEKEIIPKIKTYLGVKETYYRTVLTQGIGESFLAEKIKEWENSLYNNNLRLAYLPSPGIVRLRISSNENNKTLVDSKVKELYKLIPQYIYGEGKESLQEIVGELLKEKKLTLSLAESCTGGYVSHLITSIPGSSAFYEGTVICYSNNIKINELNVPKEIIEKKGAVSKETVEILSKNVASKFNTDYAIAISGIAGPDGGTKEKPVGTVWISIYSKGKVISKQFLFGKNRKRNIKRTAISALNMLRKQLLKET